MAWCIAMTNPLERVRRNIHNIQNNGIAIAVRGSQSPKVHQNRPMAEFALTTLRQSNRDDKADAVLFHSRSL